MVYPIAFIEHSEVLTIEHKFADQLKEKPRQIVWMYKGSYLIIPVEVVKKEVKRAKNVDGLQKSHISALYFHFIEAIEIPKVECSNIEPTMASISDDLKNVVPFDIDYTALEARILATGAKKLSTKGSPTGRFSSKPELEDNDFTKHLKMISKFVETWPKWEQEILGVAKTSPYTDGKQFVLPEHRGYGLLKGARPMSKHKPIKQFKKYIPNKVYLMCKLGAHLVGSYARFVINKADSYNDFDLIVPPDRWYAVSLLITKDAKINNHGGWKFQDNKGHTIDVWPCTIEQHLRQCKPGLGKQEYVVDYINSKVFTAYQVGIKHEK